MRYNVGDLNQYPQKLILDKGKYTVEISKIYSETTQKGSEFIVVQLVVVDGPVQSTGTSPVGRTLTHRMIIPSLQHKDQGQMAGARIRAFCEAFGIPWDPQGFDDADAIGRRAIAFVGVREFEGSEFEDIKRFVPLR